MGGIIPYLKQLQTGAASAPKPVRLPGILSEPEPLGLYSAGQQQLHRLGGAKPCTSAADASHCMLLHNVCQGLTVSPTHVLAQD